MVDHLTTVTAERGIAETRAAMIGRALVELGFERQDGRGGPVWTSSTVEAADTKRHLRSCGLDDREFRVVLDYTRQWGFL